MAKTDQQRSPDQLLNIVIGQLEGVKKMLEEEADCLRVLVQLKAAKSALNNATARIVSNNLSTCVASGKMADKEQIAGLIAELTKLD
jgi:DNA-binding FrmR family transcriptional regulator